MVKAEGKGLGIFTLTGEEEGQILHSVVRPTKDVVK